MRISAFEALSSRSFRQLWLGSGSVAFARRIELTALTWLVLQLTNSAQQVAWIAGARMLPMIVLGFAAGALADRYPKHRIIITTRVVVLLASVTMLVLLLAGRAQPWLILAYTLVTGTAGTIEMCTLRSYIAAVVPSSAMPNAMTLQSVTFEASGLLGPLLAGILIPQGYHIVFASIVAMHALGLLFMLSVEQRPAPSSAIAEEGVVKQIVDAARVVRANRVIWSALLVVTTLNFFGFSYQPVISVIARDVLKVGPGLYGLLESMVGLGSLMTGLVVASSRVVSRRRLFYLGATLVFVTMFFFALSTSYQVSLLLFFVSGIGAAAFSTMQFTIVMEAAPPEMSGRVVGAEMLAIGAMPLGIFLMGRLAESWGPQTALAVLTACGLVIMGTLQWRYPELLDRPTPKNQPV